MAHESAVARLSDLSVETLGVFRGCDAVERGVSRKQLSSLRRVGVIERLLPDTYRMTVVPRSSGQHLRAALLWAGAGAAAACRSAAELYGLEGIRATDPEIVVPRSTRVRTDAVDVRTAKDRGALMLRRRHGVLVTGVEPTLVALAAVVDPAELGIACEEARRRRLTSVPTIGAYLARFGRPGRAGITTTRRLPRELDPMHPARSTLEVQTRRLLTANGFTDFVREFPLTWRGRTYRYDFAFERSRTILETNGRRWHDDPKDYERDNEKWSVPGRLGYRIIFATWAKVTSDPAQLLLELSTAQAA